MSKILLISAPRPNSNQTAMHMGDGRPPMGLAYISAYVEKFGHETKIIDLYHFGGGHKDEEVGAEHSTATISHIIRNDKPYDIFGEIEKYKPDFIGMYLGTISYYEGTELALKIKAKYPNIPTMVGGPHAIELPHTLVDYFDYVVCGEGEKAAMDIINGNAKKGIVKRDNIVDINKLPLELGWFVSYSKNSGSKFPSSISIFIVSSNNCNGSEKLISFFLNISKIFFLPSIVEQFKS